MLTPKNLKSSKPLFISVEGGEGVGKTTQLKMLMDYLTEQKLPFIFTREPGGCKSAEELRSMLVEGDADRWDGISEALLYTAARNENLRHNIRPALAKGEWVICDRFADSTTVYQGHGKGIEREELLKLHNLVVKDTWPDLTVILDGPLEQTLNRANNRQGSVFGEDTTAETRFENLEIEFHQRVRDGFLQIAKENPNRCRVIDAIGTQEEVHQRILSSIEEFIQAKAA